MNDEIPLFSNKELFNFGKICFEYGMVEGARRMAKFVNKEKIKEKAKRRLNKTNGRRKNLKRGNKKLIKNNGKKAK